MNSSKQKPSVSKSIFKPGGTMIGVRGHIAGRVINKTRDEASDSNGRWTVTHIRGKGSTVISIFSVYRVCGYDGGENTAYIQQQNDLYDKHKRILDPRQQLCKDLQKVLHDLLVQGNKIIVTADINDDAGEEYNNQWNTMAKELSLRNILQHKHNNKDLPRTYDRGTRCLDTILVSPNIDNKDVTKAGILPFYSITSSDNRPQYIDINMESLFEDTSMDLTKISNKRFTTKNIRKCEIYLKTLYQSFQEANIFNKVTKIKNDIQMFITKVEKSGRYIGGETQKQLDEKLLLEHRIQVLDTK